MRTRLVAHARKPEKRKFTLDIHVKDYNRSDKSDKIGCQMAGGKPITFTTGNQSNVFINVCKNRLKFALQFTLLAYSTL